MDIKGWDAWVGLCPRLLNCNGNLLVDVEAEATPALEYEKWLCDRIIARIPGGG